MKRGFTLIEVLVVMVIIAVVAGVAVIAFAGLGGSRNLEHAAQEFHEHLAWACELAVLDGRSMGLALTNDHGYRFLERVASRWQAVQDRPALASRRLPQQVDLQLYRDGRRLDPDRHRDGRELALQPQIACLASGEMTPFTAVFRDGNTGQRHTLTGYIDMQIEVQHDTRAH